VRGGHLLARIDPVGTASSIATTIFVAGLLLVTVHAPGWLHPRALVGYGLFMMSVGIICGAAIVTQRKNTEGARKLRRARRIIVSLIEQGDGLVHSPGIVPVATDDPGCSGTFMISGSRGPDSHLEQWRETVGAKLEHPPFKPGTGGWALSQVGNRYSDVLDRLREIEAAPENWVE